VFQAVEAFRLFTGMTPDAERMARDFAELGAAVSRTLKTIIARTRKHMSAS
jgi:shikimate dehydrogenase